MESGRIILHLRVRTKAPELVPLAAFLARAIPYYQAPGGIRVRLLRHRNDPARYIEVVEYDTPAAFAADEDRVAHDARIRAVLAEWHALLAVAVEVEVYEDVTHLI